ncbi:MAG: macro domain-containing protein [Acidimicrobiia bacterium]
MTVVTVITGDITHQQVDAIVNAAGEGLHHGGGVALAIAEAGGPAIREESDQWIADHGPLSPGVAAVTSAGDMPARIVIHVAGPRYGEGGDDAALLALAVDTALDTAVAQGCRSVAMPAISAGIFGYPLAEACRVIADAVTAWIGSNPDTLEEARLIGFDDATTDAFRLASDNG